MNKETFEEYRYAIRHKPTKKWVVFRNDDLELTVTLIELVDFKDCIISPTKGILEKFLKMSAFNNTPNYGNENFLEFELVKIKTTYTIEEHENTN
jgi:hypothetical protein